MRVIAAGLLLAVPFALPAGTPAFGHKGGTPKCRTAGVKVLMRSALVTVSQRKNDVTQICYSLNGRVTALDRRPTLAEAADPTFATVYAINHRFVAYSHRETWSRHGSVVLFRVMDARRGKVVTNVDMYSGSTEYSFNVGGSSSDVELTSDGSVAWLSTLPEPSSALELRAARRGADASTLITTSPAIEPGSLAMSRRYVYWRQDSATHSFVLSM